MKILGIRFVTVDEKSLELATLLRDGVGLPVLGEFDDGDGYDGAVFEAGDSWIEVWPVGPGMPPGIMLQIIVDNADAWAERAKRKGIEPQGPIDVHGDRCYALTAPTGLPITVQSKIRG